jgi:methylglutaconyl-CoA hydratase
LGVRSAKSAINAGIEVDLHTGLNIERLNYLRVLNSSDRIEGLKAFSEKRSPNYQGK